MLSVRSFLGADFYASAVFCCYKGYSVDVMLIFFQILEQMVLFFIKITVTSCYHLRNDRIMCELT